MNQTKIIELDQARRVAMVNADLPVLEELFAPELLWIHSSGRIDSKKEMLEAIASRATIYHSLDVSDEHVRLAEGVAIITGIVNMSVTSKGVDMELAIRFTNVWVPVNDSYKLIHWQSTGLR